MNHQKYTNQLLGYAICFILGFVLGCNVGCGKGGKEVKSTSDTVYLPGEKTIERIPTLVLENGRIPDDTKTIIDSFISYDIIPVDSNEIIKPWIEKYNEVAEANNKLLEEYETRREYVDSARFDAGLVTVKNKVSKNKIQGQQIFLDSARLITNTAPLKKRNEVYFSMGGIYNQTALSVGGGLTLKTKRDRMFGVNAYLGTDGQVTYNFQTAFKISLRRK